MNTALDIVLKHPAVWRGKRQTCTHENGMDENRIASGFAGLDEQLPGGGWPRGALTEIMLPQPGIGELRLILPALRQLNRDKKWIALIAPPYIPYAPAWQAMGLDLSRVLWIHPRDHIDQLWAVEQALQSGTCGAVLSWQTTSPGFERLRRLQLAAESSHCWGVLFRPMADADESSPAAVRVRLTAKERTLDVHFLKRRGAWGGEAVQLPLPLFTVVK